MIPKRYELVDYEKDVPQNIKDLFEKSRDTRKGIYIFGGVGTGKTHIAYALLKRWNELRKYEIENNEENKSEEVLPRPYGLLWNTTELLYELRKSYKTKEQDFIDDIVTKKAFLFLDDIGSEKVTDWVEELFYLIVNTRYEKVHPMVFTSNLPLSQLAEKIGDRTVSRIKEMCHIIELKGEDRRLGK